MLLCRSLENSLNNTEKKNVSPVTNSNSKGDNSNIYPIVAVNTLGLLDRKKKKSKKS